MSNIIKQNSVGASETASTDVLKTDFDVNLALQQAGINPDDVDFSTAGIANIIAANPDIDTASEETLFDQGGFRKRLQLTGAATLYVSSSDSGDTTQSILVVGLDENYNEVLGVAALNGQNQVEVVNFFGGGPLTFIIVHSGAKASGLTVDLLGDVYIAETDTLTGGVPDDSTKVQGKIPEGDNITHNGFLIVPAGKAYLIKRISFLIGKAKDARFIINIQPLDGANVKIIAGELFQNTFLSVFSTLFTLREKTYVEFSADTNNNNSSVSGLADFITINDPTI